MDESRIALLPLDCDNAVEKGSRAIVSIRSKTGLETNAVREQVSEGAERVGSAVCDLEKSREKFTFLQFGIYDVQQSATAPIIMNRW